MKISIENFKAIKSLADFELKPLTVLSGVNSSGKSSFIQLLLLLKQTLNLDSSRNPLYLNGDLFQVTDYKDIITSKDLANKLKVAFEFTKEEDTSFPNEKRITIFDSYQTFIIKIEVIFDYRNGQLFITTFSINYSLPTGDKKEQFVKFETILGEVNKYKIEANNLLFGDELWGLNPNVTDLQYSSIFPQFYEITEMEVGESTKTSGEHVHQQISNKYFPKVEGIKALLQKKFDTISYIGPLRDQPKDAYAMSNSKRYVGKLGEFTAQILENFATEPIAFNQPTLGDDEITYTVIDAPLLDAVKYWMCDIFKIGIDIYAKRNGDAYTIFLKNAAGIETTIKHVGFGISQILPIVVEGLLMPGEGTLILEQPEIHLHP